MLATKPKYYGERKICCPLLLRNTQYPVEKTFHGATHRDGQTKIVFELFEGEHLEREKNQFLGSMTLKGIKRSPRGVEQADVTIKMNALGVISVSAKDRRTGKECKIKLSKPQQLSQEEISEKMNTVNQLRKAAVPSDFLTDAGSANESIINLKPIVSMSKRAKIGKCNDRDEDFCPIYGRSVYERGTLEFDDESKIEIGNGNEGDDASDNENSDQDKEASKEDDEEVQAYDPD